MDNKIAVSITFDDNNQIRVLDSEKFRDTENLKGECIDFLKSTLDLSLCNSFSGRDYELQRYGRNADRRARLAGQKD